MSDEEKNLQLKHELSSYRKLLSQAAETVRDQDVSNYPIVIVFKGEPIALGLSLIVGEENQWSMHISTLEELVTRRVIEEDKIDDFRRLYKDKKDQLCLLVWEDSSARFVFLPQNA